MFETQPRHERQITEPPREVLIPTATAIVCRSDNPAMILVGDSVKHGRPVLPGGKIDLQDLVSTSLERCAAACINRELGEEIGATPTSLRLFAVTADSERDVRRLKVGALQGSIAEQFARDLPADASIIGCHGVPDFLFIARVDPAMIASSAELRSLRWIDCRAVSEESLGAGHGKFVRRYTEALFPRTD